MYLSLKYLLSMMAVYYDDSYLYHYCKALHTNSEFHMQGLEKTSKTRLCDNITKKLLITKACFLHKMGWIAPILGSFFWHLDKFFFSADIGGNAYLKCNFQLLVYVGLECINKSW